MQPLAHFGTITSPQTTERETVTERKTQLLIDEPPLQVLPSLAELIGLNEAIFVQQLHYWLGKSPHWHDGKPWIYNDYEKWHRQFPFWSVRTIKRIVSSLREKELVETRTDLNKFRFDQTLWYTIDYESLGELDHVANMALPE